MSSSRSDRLWAAARTAAAAFDALPVSPASVGDRLLDSYLERRRSRASLDPTWSGIEARRRTDRGGSILLSSAHDLDLSHAETQRRIEDELAPEPVWLPLARSAREASLSRGLGALRSTLQRARRGWADSDVWDLRSHHERVLGEQLLHLAATAHGWPCTDEFPTFEDWAAALSDHGTVLVQHGWTGVSEEESLDRWHAVATSPTSTEEEQEAARVLRDAEEAAAVERVRVSLHWVADHNPHLWD